MFFRWICVPSHNTREDGYAWAAPVDAYGPQNAWGLYNMVGNVWEWTVTRWCPAEREGEREEGDTGTFHAAASPLRRPASCAVAGPGHTPSAPEMVQKGGSFLCHPTSCFRYRVAARHKATADSATFNVGFRCVYDVEAPMGLSTRIHRDSDDAL